MQITFLGTGSGAPTRIRNVSAAVLHLPERSEQWLIDCGEGTQHQILRTPQVRPSQINRIFITHLHGDHFYGLPGLLASRALAQGGDEKVTIYAPSGLESWLKTTLAASYARSFGFPLDIQTIRGGKVFEDVDFEVWSVPTRHRIESYAFKIIEKDLPGRFDIAQAQSLGIPPGPLYGKLKSGETVTLEDGRIIDGNTLVGEPRPGRKVVFSGDTGPCSELVELSHDADLLIHEATYTLLDQHLADRAAHATATLAAEVARDAGVRELLLTHISPRYEGEGPQTLDMLLSEAQTIFPHTRLAHDFLRVNVARREPD
jgi:ribonuclease Z